jgi:hypothetical protein
MVKFIKKTILPTSVQQLNPTVDGEDESNSCSWAGGKNTFLPLLFSHGVSTIKLKSNIPE